MRMRYAERSAVMRNAGKASQNYGEDAQASSLGLIVK